MKNREIPYGEDCSRPKKNEPLIGETRQSFNPSSNYGLTHGTIHRIKRRISSSIYNVRKSPGLFAADLISAGMSLVFAFFLRYSIEGVLSRVDTVNSLLVAGPQYIAVCAIVFPLVGLYSRNWRYGSISDYIIVARAVVVTTALLVCVLFLATRLQDVPRSAILIDALLLTSFLVASRIGYRMGELGFLGWGGALSVKEQSVPALLVGAGDAADLYLRALSKDKFCAHMPVGCLDVDENHHGMMLRGVPIVGTVERFREAIEELKRAGRGPRHIIFTESPASLGDELSERLLSYAETAGISASRLSRITELRNATREDRLELRSIELADLLERQQASLDHGAIVSLLRGRRVLITGAGGSIGSELTLQVAACEPAEIVLIENSEYNLYEIDMALAERFPELRRTVHMCDVRHERRVNDIFDMHQPELVFHAAALKHVPMVELNPCEGALTNVIGTMNVANATRRFRAKAMVQISTDKVVNPTSFMGATKRLAELYCQALDIKGFENNAGPRFMTVRFGNVLGSSGSLIPLFKKQLAKGGPLTVTDEDMTRFFMTIREAVELTLQASSYGLQGEIGQGEIFVLDMGAPIKIIDIARRMIKLSGLRPDIDIPIKVVGLRPGEKLFEELFDTAEQRVESPVPGVLGAIPDPVPLAFLENCFSRLRLMAESGDRSALVKAVREVLPTYEPGVVSSAGPAPDRATVAAIEVAPAFVPVVRKGHFSLGARS